MRALVVVGLFAACGEGSMASMVRSDAGGTIGPVPASFASGDTRLAYSLDLPGGVGPFPAVVLGHGSGRVTRDMLLPLARRFVERGYAVLRYDKRGVGQSGGAYRGVSTLNSVDMIAVLAGDMAAGVAFVQSLTSIDPGRVGLAGGSQAGWIIPVAASQASGVKFAVIISGPTISVGRQILYFDLADGTATTQEQLSAALAAYQGPEGFDPRSTLAAETVPILWLYGARDRAVPVPESVGILEELAGEGGRPFRWKVYPGADHSLSVNFWPEVDEFLAALP